MSKPSILFIGAGRMAEAIISGLHKNSYNQINNVFITNRTNPERLQKLSELYGAIQTQDWLETLQEVEIVVLAIPPQAHESVLDQLKDVVTNQFIITIAAGIDPTFLEARLPADTAVGWIMPNTAAQVGHSISLYTFGIAVTEKNKQLMNLIVNSIGSSQLCTEADIHCLTAVTGSAPAFMYQFVESLIVETEKLGVSNEVAHKLVTEMVNGSVEMLKTGKSPIELRDQVATPGGATEAGLEVLKESGLDSMIQNAIIVTNKKARDSKSTA